MIRIYGNSIYWKSKKQNIVTKSSTEAEYVALSVCVSEIKLMRELLKEFEPEIKKPIRIYEDNKARLSVLFKILRKKIRRLINNYSLLTDVFHPLLLYFTNFQEDIS